MEVGVAYSVTEKWPKMEWVATAFERIGHSVRRINHSSGLPQAFDECDFVILAQKSIAGRWPNVKDALSNRKCPAVYWWFDLIATNAGIAIHEQPLFKTFEQQLTACDVVLVKEADFIDDYRMHGVNAFWFDQGCLSDYPEIVLENPVWDVLLWGQANAYRERYRDAEWLVSQGFSVAWAVEQGSVPKGVDRLPWTHAMDLHRLASKARCVLSCGFRNDLSGYWSDGFWMALAMGSCVVRKRTPGLPEGPYLIYHTREELRDSVQWVVQNPKLANAEGVRAREWATTKHSLEQRARDLIQIVTAVREPGSGLLQTRTM